LLRDTLIMRMSATLILGMSWLWKTPPDRDYASHEPDVAGGRAAGDPALAEPGRIAADRYGRRDARDGWR
jgi:hypothetical protein